MQTLCQRHKRFNLQNYNFSSIHSPKRCNFFWCPIKTRVADVDAIGSVTPNGAKNARFRCRETLQKHGTKKRGPILGPQTI